MVDFVFVPPLLGAHKSPKYTTFNSTVNTLYEDKGGDGYMYQGHCFMRRNVAWV